jgi:hypothetical protein
MPIARGIPPQVMRLRAARRTAPCLHPRADRRAYAHAGHEPVRRALPRWHPCPSPQPNAQRDPSTSGRRAQRSPVAHRADNRGRARRPFPRASPQSAHSVSRTIQNTTMSVDFGELPRSDVAIVAMRFGFIAELAVSNRLALSRCAVTLSSTRAVGSSALLAGVMLLLFNARSVSGRYTGSTAHRCPFHPSSRAAARIIQERHQPLCSAAWKKQPVEVRTGSRPARAT